MNIRKDTRQNREQSGSLLNSLRWIRFSLFILVLVLIILFTSLLYFSGSIHSSMLSGYQQLQNYYNTVSQSADEIKQYLRSGSEGDLAAYRVSLAKASDQLNLLQSNRFIEQRWRFDLLDSMLDSYDSTVENLTRQYETNRGPVSYQVYYEEFLHKEELILNTSTDFYALMTDSMNKMKNLFSLLLFFVSNFCR